jgi:hypothetical protein
VTWQLTDDTCAVDSGAPSDAGGDGADASDGGTDAGVADAADAG